MNRISTVHALWIGIYIYNKILICGGFLKQKNQGVGNQNRNDIWVDFANFPFYKQQRELSFCQIN